MHFVRNHWINCSLALLLAAVPLTVLAGGKLLATGGVSQIEGAGGGGLTPWALIGGLGTEDEIGISAFATRVGLTDYRLDTAGIAIGIFDRMEFSLAQQRFTLNGRVLPGNSIRQDIFGAKLKVSGDAVFDQDRAAPQVAVGLQHKRNEDFGFIPAAVGAKSANGTDFYVTATKLYLGAVAGRNLLLSGTLRATKANQFGLLGFGGDRKDGYSTLFEGSAGVFLNDHWLVATEYRDKPDNLSAAREQAAKDAFVAFFPGKHVAIIAAYVSLGPVAGFRQRGWYLSLNLSH
ncbi:MAG: DUF3034 family protein [Betaproteobacteria bacterium]